MADKSFGIKELNLIGASGTPTITSPNNLNLNASNVAISTDVTVGRHLDVDGHAEFDNVNIAGVTTFSSAINVSSSYGTSGQVLTSQGSGSAPQWATPAGGKILQVVHQRYSTATSVSCANNTWSAANLNASITPSSTSSTILVYFSLMHDWSASNPPYEGMFNLFRDSTNLAENPSPSTAPGSRNLGLVPGVITQAGSDNPKQASVSGYRDSPSTTSSITYTVYVRQTVGSTQTLYLNRLASDTNNSNYERGVSWITLMEVQG